MARIEGTLPARVSGLRTRIEHWRRHRESRAMPEDLWAAAAALARRHGVSAVSQALRLHYGALKRRVGGGGRGVVPRRKRAARFVEVATGPWLGRPAVEGPTVELWGADGSRLVIRIAGGEGVDVLAVAAALWKRR